MFTWIPLFYASGPIVICLQETIRSPEAEPNNRCRTPNQYGAIFGLFSSNIFFCKAKYLDPRRNNINFTVAIRSVSSWQNRSPYYNMGPVKRICVFEHSVMTNFNCACPAIQRGQGSGFLSEGSSWFTTCMNEQRRFWRDCADAQARLNLRCSHRR